MTSLRNNPEPRDGYLDAARACILDVGWRRTTLTEVARRAGVSRMTIYRAWSDMPTLLGDLMTREWGEVVAAQPAAGDPADVLVATVQALRENELFVRIVELDPELLLPYLLARRGRSQEAIATLLEARIVEGQAAGDGPGRQPHRHGTRPAAGRPRVRAVGADDGRRRRAARRPGRGATAARPANAGAVTRP